EIDSRTSDALALAVRFGCPVFTYEHILDSAGIMMEDSSSSKRRKASPTSEEEEEEEPSSTISGGKEDLRSLSLDDLNTLLGEVLEQEDYIRAIAIRDEINNRKKRK
ncbi:MAG: hypothetical protein EOO16_24490, partial [Chitinophagaceae bacterium]